MATVPQEQTVQRAHYTGVAIAAHGGDTAGGELFWAAKTEGLTVTTDKSVVANQADIATVITRVEALPDIDLPAAP